MFFWALACAMNVEPGSIWASATSLDLGEVEPGEEALGRVTLTHRGETAVNLVADVTPPFGLGEVPTRLAGGDSVGIEVVLVGAVPGVHSGQLTVWSDGADGGLVVDVVGRVLEPELSLTPTLIVLEARTDASADLSLHNDGAGLLTVTVAVEGDARITASPRGLEVAPGETRVVSVAANAAPGAEAQIVVETNDPDHPRTVVPVSVDPLGLVITSPADGDQFMLVEELLLSTTVVSHSSVESVMVTWTSSIDGELATARVAADGTTSVNVQLSDGLHELEVWAEGADASASGGVAVLVACGTEDIDGDGVSECDGDCGPLDITVGLHASEICEDGIDQDCDGEDKSCLTTFTGIVTDIDPEDLDGWTICYEDAYQGRRLQPQRAEERLRRRLRHVGVSEVRVGPPRTRGRAGAL